MRVAVVLFTRDLRVDDHPALATAALEAEHVVPLFVFDPAIGERAAPARVRFLLESLRDLDGSLARLGAGLVVRRGDPVAETLRAAVEAGATSVFVSEDVSAYAQSREERLRRELARRRIDLRTFPGVTVVPPGDLSPSGQEGPFRVFTPYWRHWRVASRRALLDPPPALRPVSGIAAGAAPDAARPAGDVGAAFPGGEQEGRARLERWVDSGLSSYEESRDDLASPGTSLLSPYLHLGCLSALEVAEAVAGRPGGEAFARQLCWRDFHHQLHWARPELATEDLRPRGLPWRDDADGLAAWCEGLTGYPIVDAAMRQLAAEGFLPNRARMLVASFLTKHLLVDWRSGAGHFDAHLVDGDVANNAGNWQWVAGTGADTRPNRVLNPTRQAKRFDPAGDYVRRWVPELAGLEGAAVHEPWRLDRRPRGYPSPIVSHEEALERLRAAGRPRS